MTKKATKQPAGQVATWRARPSRKAKLYYVVRVFKTVKHMLTYAKAAGSHPGRFAKGLCRSYEIVDFSKRGTRKTKPEAGELLFAKNYTGMEVVTHECTHAVLSLARRKLVDPEADERGTRGNVGKSEEQFCYMAGQLARHVAVGLWRHKLVK